MPVTGRGNFCKSSFFLMWAKQKSMNDIMEGTCIELPTSIFWCRYGRSATISFKGLMRRPPDTSGNQSNPWAAKDSPGVASRFSENTYIW